MSLEQQFNRIEDLDKNLAAVKSKLDNATVQMEQFNTTQTHISSAMSELKNNTAKQFTAINQRLPSNMERQDKISTTMLDLREHFEKMSAFMESLANQMERDRQQSSSGTQSQATTAGVHSFTAGGGATDSSSNSSASRTSGSSMSRHSLQSTASLTVYCSPEKKKQRSSQKLGNKKSTTARGDYDNLSDELEEGQGPLFMDVCTNLDETFLSQDDSSLVLSRAVTMSIVPNSSAKISYPTTHHPASLDPKNNNTTDLVGADRA